MRGELRNLILESKNGNELSKVKLLEKYKPLIIKVAFNYYVKGYDNEDLIQMATMWFLVAIDKYNMDKNSDFSSYVMRTINNNMRALIRKIAKENYEKSIYDKNPNGITLEDTLEDEFNIVENYEKQDNLNNLKEAIEGLEEGEKEFIIFIHSKNTGMLTKWANDENISYAVARRRRDNILKKLRNSIKI